MTGKRVVVILPVALEEAEGAIDWYAQENELLAERFLDDVTDTIDRIADRPHQFPTYHFGTRRALLKHFPFAVVFRETPDMVEVIAVAHGRRKPGYWRERLG